MAEYTLKLAGPDPKDPRVPLSGSLVRGLFEALDSGARGAVRLRLEGRSAAQGSPPGWLHRASFFRLDGLTEDFTGFRLSAPPLAEVIPPSLPQYDLIDEEDSAKTSLTLFADGLRDAINGTQSSDAFDASLLKTYGDLEQVFHEGVVSLELRNSDPYASPLEVSADSLDCIKLIQPASYEPREVRVAGHLNTIRASDRALVLVLGSGHQVRGALTPTAHVHLAEYFGHDAVVSGHAIFRPSGSLLRIDVHDVTLASPNDMAMWGSVPRPLETGFALRELVQPQTARTGAGAVFGFWRDRFTDSQVKEAFSRLREG